MLILVVFLSFFSSLAVVDVFSSKRMSNFLEKTLTRMFRVPTDRLSTETEDRNENSRGITQGRFSCLSYLANNNNNNNDDDDDGNVGSAGCDPLHTTSKSCVKRLLRVHLTTFCTFRKETNYSVGRFPELRRLIEIIFRSRLFTIVETEKNVFSS